MHVVIMGCGRVGSALARAWSGAGTRSRSSTRTPTPSAGSGPTSPAARSTGVGFDREVLIEAGIERADAFAAVSSGDNSNIISARVARETFGVDRVVARIYDPSAPRSTSGSASRPSPRCRWTADRMVRHAPAGRRRRALARPDQHGRRIVRGAAAPRTGSASRSGPWRQATGARVAFLMRFGIGALPTARPCCRTATRSSCWSPTRCRRTVSDVTAAAAAPPQEG